MIPNATLRRQNHYGFVCFPLLADRLFESWQASWSMSIGHSEWKNGSIMRRSPQLLMAKVKSYLALPPILRDSLAGA